MKIRTILKVVGIIVACYFVYVLTAALIPFAHQKGVSETKQTFDKDSYYSSSYGVDRAMIIEDNEEALEERIRMIQGAKKTLVMSTFDMRMGHSAEDVVSALVAAADRGVKVKILVDGMMGLVHMNHDMFYAMSSHENIEVKMYNVPSLVMPWTMNGRLHDKYLIADDTVLILGGRNTYDYFLGDYITENKSYDRDVLVYNTDKSSKKSAIYQVEDYFSMLWTSKYCTTWKNDSKLREDEDVAAQVVELNTHYKAMKRSNPDWFTGYQTYEARTQRTYKVSLISGEIGIYGKEPLVWYQLSKLMETAKQSVKIHTPYAVMGSDMYDGLRRVAQTVPEVTMMVNAVEVGDNFVASSDYIFNKRKVAETGVTLQEFVGDMSYHGKSIVIDNELAVIGSYNMDLRSTYMDTELMLCVDCPDLAKELSASMTEYEAQAKQVMIKDDELQYKVDDLIIEDMPWYLTVGMRVTGFVLQAVRYVI